METFPSISKGVIFLNLLTEFENDEYFLISKKSISCCFFKESIPADFIANPLAVEFQWAFVPTLGAVVFHIYDSVYDLPYEIIREGVSTLFEYDASVPERVSVPGIGPHEGIEYALMNQGDKNIAYFSDFVPFDFLLNPSRIDLKCVCAPYWGVIYYNPEFSDDAQELYFLLRKSIHGFQISVERRIGELLGYSTGDIDTYIKHWQDNSKN